MRAALLIVFIAATANGQQTTNYVRVRLTGACRNISSSIQLVLNGNETSPIRLKAVDTTTGQEWIGRDFAARFPAGGSFASARLGGTRSDCRRSVAERNDDAIEAVFTFDCDENPASQVLIETEPMMSASFVRFLRSGRNDPLDCDCREAGHFSGQKSLEDVRLPEEVLNLQLGLNTPDRDVLWLHLNDLPIFKPKLRASRTLDHDEVLQAIIRSTPGEGFSSNAYEVNRVVPKLQGLTKLTLTVK